MMAELRLYLLGAPRVEMGGQPQTVERRKALALLAYLALTPGAHSRDTLAALLWPGYDATTSRGNLRRTLSELNKTLGGTALEIGRDAVALARDGRAWSDAAQFETLLDHCRGHDHRETAGRGDICPACREWLTQAVALYRDDLLAGFTLADSAEFDEWQTLQTAHLRRRCGEALARLVRGCLDAGDLDAAFAYAQRRLALDVLDEDAHRRLMQLYAWRGERSAALRQYDDCVRLLAAELSVAPQAATGALRAAIAADRLPPPPIAAPNLPSRPTEQPALLPTGELRLVTVLVAGLSMPLDVEEVAPPPPGLRATMLAALAAAGATAQPHLDDGVIGIFGLDQLHEDDAERAVVAALALGDRAAAQGVAVGVGVHTGRVYVAADAAAPSMLGPVVNLAARLRDQAAAGHILLSRAAYDLAQRGVRAAPAAPLVLPGTARPLEVYRVERMRRRPRRMRSGEGRRTPLVGRGEELGMLTAALAALRQGQGGVLLLTGEAGMGKSRLVEELAELATAAPDAPVLWLEGRCLEMTQAAAYAPFVSMLQAHLATVALDTPLGAQLQAWLNRLAAQQFISAEQRQEMGPLLARLLAVHDGEAWEHALAATDPQQLQYRTFVALRDLITALARRGPLVIALDDLHWADDLSLDLLGELLGVVMDAPLLLACAYRDVPDHRSQQLAQLVGQRCPGRVRQIQVGALAPDQTHRLAVALLGGGEADARVLSEIQARTQGNPFFVEEIVHNQVETGALILDGEVWRSRGDAADDGLPATIQSVILSRVDRLAPGPRRLLRRAAVIGQTFMRALLAEVAQEADLTDALATLEGRGFVYRTRTLPAPEYAFWHALTQQAVYATLPRAARAAAHAQVAAAIEKLYALNLDDHAVALAYHYDRSEDREKAIVYLLQAGEKLRRDYVNAEAIAHFRRALERVDQLSPQSLPVPDALDRWRYEAAVGLGRLYTTGANLVQAEHYLHMARRLAQTLKLPPAEVVRLYAALGEVLYYHPRSAEMTLLAEEGLSLLDDQPSVELAVMNHLMWTSLRVKDFVTWQGLEYAARNARFIHSLPYEEELRPPYWSTIVYFLVHKDLDSALHLLQLLQDKAGARGDLRGVGEAILHRAIVLWLQGNLAASLNELGHAAGHMNRIGDVLRLVWNLSVIAHVQLFAGQLAAARQSLHHRARLLATLGIQKGTPAPADHLYALLSLCDGDPQRALADLQKMRPAVDEQPYTGRSAVLLLQTELLRHAGDSAAARLPLDHAFAIILENAPDLPALWCGAGGPFMLLLLPVAEALSKLDTVTTPDAFRARCRELRGQYPAFAPDFTHWYLEPAQPDPDFGAGEVWLPHADMTWVDPLDDCRYIADGEGIIVYAANGRDLWQLNRSAPRLLRPMTGDFALECTVAPAHTDRPAMGGLLLWQDEKNYVRLHWGVRRPDEIGFDGCLANRDLGFGRGKLPGAGVVLRLERRGNRVTALCRAADDPQWYTAGALEFPADGSLWTGVHAVGYIDRAVYPAAYPDGAALRLSATRLAR